MIKIENSFRNEINTNSRFHLQARDIKSRRANKLKSDLGFKVKETCFLIATIKTDFKHVIINTMKRHNAP